MRSRFHLAAAIVVFGALAPMNTAHSQTTLPAADAPARELSPQTLEALVTGVALYPDPLVEQILDAAMYPLALHQAAELARTGQAGELSSILSAEFPPSVKYLQSYPSTLAALDAQLSITARLGAAYRVQPDDVWAAIGRVRAQIDAAVAAQQSSAAGETVYASGESGGASASYYAYPYAVASGVVTRRLLGAAAWHELNEDVVTSVAGGAASATIVGPNGGVATGAGAAGAATVGDTTYAGAAGAATATGPGGTTVYAAGGGKGSIEQTDTGANFQSTAQGAFQTSNGAWGYGAHSSSGSVNTNADGSTSFSRQGSTSLDSSYGSTDVQHEGSGTATGTGGGSYEGSTTIDSTHGDASVSTTAGDGQVSTTVTRGDTQNTYTAGDQQVTAAPQGDAAAEARTGGSQATASSERTSGGAASTQQQRGGSSERYWQMTTERVTAADQALAQNWGALGEQARSLSNERNAAGSPTGLGGTVRHSIGDAQQLNGGRNGGASTRTLNQGVRSFSPPVTSPRTLQSPSIGTNRSPGSFGGGRRGGGRRR